MERAERSRLRSFSPGADGTTTAALARLRTADAVRERCRLVHRWVAEGRSSHFTLDETRLEAVADYVADVTRMNHPDLAIPLHSRWRHLSATGVDRWGAIMTRLPAVPADDRVRAAIDLVTVSVLLDAGAGAGWRYREAESGSILSRSEGLAIASLRMFAEGAFSSDPRRPLQADGAALLAIDADRFARGLQCSADNPLAGLERRVELLRRLGQALTARADLFGRAARPGHLLDHFPRTAQGGRLPAPLVLETLVEGLAPIWPSGLAVQGAPIGDAGRHPAARTNDATCGIVPFHKLTQWLAYSLIEPLQWAGLVVTEFERLTGLAEYRNGGLFIDLGVIRPRRPVVGPQAVSSEIVVEWRALTVALIDDLLEPVRKRLGLGADFALPHLLQGGTWSAGRKIARTLRPPDGPPPIVLIEDGTVF